MFKVIYLFRWNFKSGDNSLILERTTLTPKLEIQLNPGMLLIFFNVESNPLQNMSSCKIERKLNIGISKSNVSISNFGLNSRFNVFSYYSTIKVIAYNVNSGYAFNL